MTIQERLRPGKYKLTVDDYLHLDDIGVFNGRRTELLDGDIIVMNAEYRPHGWVTGELHYALRRALEAMAGDLHVMGASVRMSDHDMPLPDIVLTREPRGEGPIPLNSVALVVEVSSTTLSRDLGRKEAIYARAGVPEYWVADLGAKLIHQLWMPQGDSYADRRSVALGERIEAMTIPGLAITPALD